MFSSNLRPPSLHIYGAPSLLPRGPRPRAARASRATARRRATLSRARRAAGSWIARAQAVTVRRLVDEVEWVVERRAAGVSAAASEPPPPGTRLVLPERQMRAQEECPPVDAEIIFFAPASLAILLREVIAAFAKPLEPP